MTRTIAGRAAGTQDSKAAAPTTHESTIAELTRLIKAAPKDATTYGARARAYYEEGDFELALADATRAIELAPDAGRSYLDRGRIFAAMRLISAARQDFQRGASLGEAAAQKELWRV